MADGPNHPMSWRYSRKRWERSLGFGIRVVPEGWSPSGCGQETDESCDESREESVPDVRRSHTRTVFFPDGEASSALKGVSGSWVDTKSLFRGVVHCRPSSDLLGVES
jgi:hypothetical protein